jgi:4-hydroxy-3-polyprenylbenzoate decarboxylase
MLTCSKQGLPKIAMVFDDDVDIWDDNRISQCMAFRYMPDRDTIIIPQCNTMSTDPKLGDVDKPFYCSKIGLDCTVPLVGNWNRQDFEWSSAVDLGNPPQVAALSEQALTDAMSAFIKEAPRSWEEILKKFHGQPYPVIYRAFSNLRHQLGRANDSPWFRYTFSSQDFASVTAPTLRNFDPRHQLPSAAKK